MNLITLLISVIFGLMGAGLAFLLTKAIYGTEDLFCKLPIHWMWWPAIGAIFIGIGGYLIPQVLGVGYDTIGQLVSGQLIITNIILFLLIKSIIWIIALGSGTLDSLELIRAFQLYSTPIVTFMEKETIGEVLTKISQNKELYIFQNYPIVSEQKGVIGMVSSKELWDWAEKREVVDPALGDRFCRSVATVFFYQSGREISEQMIMNGVNHVVVLDENKQPIGMITSRSLLEARKKGMDEELIRKRYIYLLMSKRKGSGAKL